MKLLSKSLGEAANFSVREDSTSRMVAREKEVPICELAPFAFAARVA
jgi:hypothetical protein